MEDLKSKDFKSNVSDLTKIPPTEFEKYFQEWMERDDVARSLQAKLRCDLIKNFNKTNLGKHILSHTMSSTGGSTLRLTLSPLVLGINTLVAEFLYSQNCHFTLSVFCTEIPFRNTLPDFESMRRFRFNNEEIFEIWQAVCGSKGNKRDVQKFIIQNYEQNPNISLLMLIIKYLLKREPLEQVKRNVEVQTEHQAKQHKSISAQVSEDERKSTPKSGVKDENLQEINKYLQTLSEKVMEMTKEFEQFGKHKHESRPRTIRSSRSREFYTLNKSLERITENMKAMTQAKRKNKRLSNIVESIDHLTQQFGKCAQNFENVSKVLSTGEMEKDKRAKVKFKEKQTETEAREKSYAEWINEMRNTENGKKFLNRVESSLRKALAKHRDQLQSETDIKMKHLKSLMKLHYQQKLSKRLFEDPKINLEETRKCNDNIEKKLEQFEKKQLELLEKLHESSLELKEAKEMRQQQSNSDRSSQVKSPYDEHKTAKNHNLQKRVNKEQSERSYLNISIPPPSPKNLEFQTCIQETQTSRSLENEKHSPRLVVPPDNAAKSEKSYLDISVSTHSPRALDVQICIQETQTSRSLEKDTNSPGIVGPPVNIVKAGDDHFCATPKLLLKDVSKAQEEILVIAKNIAEQGRSVDHIIYDAKLRIQQLENESNQLEQNFQSYLERRRRNQEEYSSHMDVPKIDQSRSLELSHTLPTSGRMLKAHKKQHSLQEDRDEENDKEFELLKETLKQSEEIIQKPKSAKSDTSTSSLEIRNAILEAKLKFFEHENTLRKCREQGDEIRSGNLLQKQLEKTTNDYELPDYLNLNFGKFNSESEINLAETKNYRNEVPNNLEDSLSEICIKDKTLDNEQDIELSPMTDQNLQKSEGNSPTKAKRELFPKEDDKKDERDFEEDSAFVKDLKTKFRYQEIKSMPSKDLENNLRDRLKLKENKSQRMLIPGENNSELIKQSMAKMQQLFEQQTKSQETLREMVNEIALQREETPKSPARQLISRPNEALDKSLTSTSTTTTTTITTQSSQSQEQAEMINSSQILKDVQNFPRISSTSMPCILNLSSQSDESFDDEQLEIERTQDTIKELDNDKSKTKKYDKTSELLSHRPTTKTYPELEAKFQKEFGQVIDSPEFYDLDLLGVNSKDKEIGEFFSEIQKSPPINMKLSGSSSSSVLEISIGNQNKSSKNLDDDDSESDFWA